MTNESPDDEVDGSTPLTAEERAELIPGHITNRSELDQAEADNIGEALAWLARRRRFDFYTIDFARSLHEQMYGAVWRWAGTFSREVNRRIGRDAHDIHPALIILLGDMQARVGNLTRETNRVELLADFHHRLTKIHPFPNGNGRWARQMTDILTSGIGARPIRWGGPATGNALHIVGNAERARYLAALREGDRYNLVPLTELLTEWSGANGAPS